MACRRMSFFWSSGSLLPEVVAQQTPEGFDFGAGTLPVFDREGVEGERLDAEARAGFDGGADGADAGFVASDARQTAASGPAAVAVHDDRDVRGEPGGVDCLGQIPVPISGLERFQ